MLEGERYNVLDSFDGHGQRVSWKSLANDNLDAANLICWAPVALPKQLATELGELENLEFAVLGELWKRLSVYT